MKLSLLPASPLPTAVNDDSSDDDEPLIKMVRKVGPSEEQLRETVQQLLKNASLEDMTMKQICQQVRRGRAEWVGQPGSDVTAAAATSPPGV